MKIGEFRFPKDDVNENFLEGKRVWLKSLKWVSKKGTGKPFGRVVKDSYWPDLWVTVDVWNQEQMCDLERKENGMKRRALCPQRLR